MLCSLVDLSVPMPPCASGKLGDRPAIHSPVKRRNAFGHGFLLLSDKAQHKTTAGGELAVNIDQIRTAAIQHPYKAAGGKACIDERKLPSGFVGDGSCAAAAVPAARR